MHVWQGGQLRYSSLYIELMTTFITGLMLVFAADVAAGVITITSDDGPKVHIVTGDDVDNPVFSDKPSVSCEDAKCGPNEIRYVDEELNRVYTKHKGLLGADEAIRLRNEQRDWIDKRDIQCDVNYFGTDREKWLGHILSSDARTACVIRETESRTAELKHRIRLRSKIHFVGQDEVFHGLGQSEWVRRYWEWIRQFSGWNPSSDRSGRLCGKGQSGSVWFLTGSTGQDRTERSCTIPSDTALVIPAVNVLMQVNPGQSVSCSSLLAQVNAANDSGVSMYLRVDGVDYSELALHNVITDCFTLDDKRQEIVGDAVGGGYWAFLDALPPGEHKIEFGGVYSDGFHQDIVYHLTVQQSCSLPLQEGEADVVGVASYKGLVPETVQLGDSGHPVRSSPVVVNSPQKPVVLVLSAYDPTWWKVSTTPGTQLKGVILSGYHTQAVTGISRDIPLIKAVYEEKGSCPYFLAYRAGKDLDNAMNRVKQITGQPINKMVIEPRGDHFQVGDGYYNSAALARSNDYSIDDFPVKKGLPAGQVGIEQLIREGKLRPATKADVQQWVDAASKKYRGLSPNLKVQSYIIVSRSYVVLKPTTLPTGMYGANSRDFMIPRGVPMPNDPGSHNTYYFIETGTCRGTSPNCRRNDGG